MASHVAIIGFCNSIPYVQRQMDLLLKDFADFCRAYLDDIVVALDTFDLHIKHLTLVLEVLVGLPRTQEGLRRLSQSLTLGPAGRRVRYDHTGRQDQGHRRSRVSSDKACRRHPR